MFDGSVVVVSGVGPGVGQALVSLLIRENAKVVLGARNADRLAAFAEMLPSDSTLAIPTDINSAEDCRRLLKAGLERFGRIDALVNNAYVAGPWGPQAGRLADADLGSDWSAPFETNVKGSLRMVQAALPALRLTRGSIVMVNTVAARHVREGYGAYSVSKGALQTATRILATELAPLGIRVNTVFPGNIDGPPLQSSMAKWAKEQSVTLEEVRSQIAASLPLGEIPTSEDVAEAIMFLASRRARGITGAGLDVNGGEYIPL